MHVVLSIVEYNTSKLLRNCISSIFNEKPKTNVEIIVVDNASNDDSVEMVKKEFPKVILIDNKKNIGFGAGHNLAFKKIEGDYYIILNSDAELNNGVIDGMVDFMEENPNCGIASCKVTDFDGKLQPNGGDLPLGLALVGWLFNMETFGLKDPAFHRTDSDYYKKPHQVGWVSGNFMIIRKELLDKIGGFNEEYFMYFEDIELCFKAKKNNFDVMINPMVSIKHLSGGSLDDPKYRQWSGELIGLIKFYRQNFQGLVLIIQFLVYTSTILRIIAFALTGKLDYAKTYAKVIINI